MKKNKTMSINVNPPPVSYPSYFVAADVETTDPLFASFDEDFFNNNFFEGELEEIVLP